MRKHCPAGTVIFVHGQGGQLLSEYDSSGQPIKEYLWLGSTPVAVVVSEPGGTRVHHVDADHLDTPRVVTDRQGHLRWRWWAEPFGATAPEDNPTGLGALAYNLRFPGQYFDSESSLHYNYFRDYDASIGRYVQSDPIGLAGGINGFVYVTNNPLSYVDPRGLDAQCGPGKVAIPDPNNPGGRIFICRTHPTEPADKPICVTAECAAGLLPKPPRELTECEVQCGIGSDDAAGRAIGCAVVSQVSKAVGIPGIPVTLACKIIDKRACIKACEEKKKCP